MRELNGCYEEKCWIEALFPRTTNRGQVRLPYAAAREKRVVNNCVQMPMNANSTIDNEWHLPSSRATHSKAFSLSLLGFLFFCFHPSVAIHISPSQYHLVMRILHTIQGTGINTIDQAAVRRLIQQHAEKNVRLGVIHHAFWRCYRPG